MNSHNMHPDPIRDAGFPTVEQLWRGIVLDCIVTSFYVAAHEFHSEIYWEDDTFVKDIAQGERWAVCFPGQGAVAVFYSSESSRNPYPTDSPPYDQSWYFRGMPDRLLPAKDLVLSQMLDLNFRCRNPAGAAITAAMWADGDRFTAVEPWEKVYHHSLWECREHLLPPEISLQKWCESVHMSESTMQAAWSLYEHRIASTDKIIDVEPWEWKAYTDAEGLPPDQIRWGYVEELLAGVGVNILWQKCK